MGLVRLLAAAGLSPSDAVTVTLRLSVADPFEAVQHQRALASVLLLSPPVIPTRCSASVFPLAAQRPGSGAARPGNTSSSSRGLSSREIRGVQ